MLLFVSWCSKENLTTFGTQCLAHKFTKGLRKLKKDLNKESDMASQHHGLLGRSHACRGVNCLRVPAMSNLGATLLIGEYIEMPTSVCT